MFTRFVLLGLYTDSDFLGDTFLKRFPDGFTFYQEITFDNCFFSACPLRFRTGQGKR